MSEFLSITSQNKHSSHSKTSSVGRIGEEIAARHLVRNGYRLIVANFKSPIGRNRKGVAVNGEIDLIALDGDILCFIEVKTRSSKEFAAPVSSVNLRKQRQIIRTARQYRKIFHINAIPSRFDVVSIILSDQKYPEIELFKAFWNEGKFKKKYWSGEF